MDIIWNDQVGHLEFLQEVGDPATGESFGDSESNLRSAIAGETHEYTDVKLNFFHK